MRRWFCCTQFHASYREREHEFPSSPDEKEENGLASKSDPTKAPPPIEIPEMSLDELKEKTNNFGSKALIGEGSYGRVYYATLDSGKHIAVKKLDTSADPEPDNEFLTQLSIVSRLKHENFVEMLGYCVEGNQRLVAYEFATMGSLHDILHGRKGVPGAQPGPALEWLQRVKIAIDAAKGLAYLHEKVQPSIVHRDIRSSNVLLFEDYRAKVADFNLSNQSPDMAARLHSTRVLGTFGYHAPEYAMTGQLTQIQHCAFIIRNPPSLLCHNLGQEGQYSDSRMTANNRNTDFSRINSKHFSHKGVSPRYIKRCHSKEMFGTVSSQGFALGQL